MMVSSNSSPGNAIQASTKRCVTKSSRPPMKPVVPPISTATTTLRAVAASPTVSDSRAPWDEAAQQVAAHVVGAQQVLGRRGLQAVAQVDLLEAIGRQTIGEDADQHQDEDDDTASGPQRLLTDQPPEEPPRSSLPSRSYPSGRLGAVRRQL